MPLTFSPAPSDINGILTALSEPTTSFASVAESCGTTTHALSLWLTTPEIAEQLARAEQSTAQRIRLLATSLVPQAILALKRVLDECAAESESMPTQTDRANASKLSTIARSTRAAALTASRLLLSLAKFTPARRADAGRSKTSIAQSLQAA